MRCLIRITESLGESQGEDIEIIQGDVLEKNTLVAALKDINTAYYFVHSMAAKTSFADLDRQAARNFGEAAFMNGVRRIVYMGGLGNSDSDLSPHLRSRHEVGEVLRSSEVQVIELRSSIVLGPGSLSFEMIRALVERLPVMLTPKWISVPTQPISISDLIKYLLAALDLGIRGNKIFEIGGAEIVS